MAHEILSESTTVHLPHHDLESFFYVLIYIFVIYDGPNGKIKDGPIPEFLHNWIYGDRLASIGFFKLGMLSSTDSAFEKEVGFHFSPYFRDLKTCILRMRYAISSKTVTHQVFLDILNDTLRTLKRKEATVVSQPHRQGLDQIMDDILDKPDLIIQEAAKPADEPRITRNPRHITMENIVHRRTRQLPGISTLDAPYSLRPRPN